MNHLQAAFDRQAERICKLRTQATSVNPKQSNRELFDSPIQSIYELSRFSGMFSYLRFFAEAEIADTDHGEIPVVGELVKDTIVDEKGYSEGHIVVMPATGTLVLWGVQPDNAAFEAIIASSATSFRDVFSAFAEYRSCVGKLEFDEYGPQLFSDKDEALHLELIRTFWTYVAQSDPRILDSGSQFWSRFTQNVLGWKD